MDRMLDALNDSTECTVTETLEHLEKTVRVFVDGADQFDDITMLCLEYRGERIS